VFVVNLTQDGPDGTIGRIRLFAGYAGWAPMQLEAELERGGWFVADALPGDALTADPEQLWAAVLQRNGDPYARIPSDPRLN
jgi:putative transcriptional regulator